MPKLPAPDMSNNKERIRLAEAMGWQCNNIDHPVAEISSRCWQWIDPLGHKSGAIIAAVHPPEKFNPFTDANDDYAVLVWMRGDGVVTPEHYDDARFTAFRESLAEMQVVSANYVVGDYARAALKVLDSV